MVLLPSDTRSTRQGDCHKQPSLDFTPSGIEGALMYRSVICTWQPAPDDKKAARPTSGTYQPPHASLVINTPTLQRPQSRFSNFALSSASSRQDGYPPPFFKRLDKYIKDNGFRARDVFVAIDCDNDQRISVDEMISGLNRIDFKISKKEERMLREWMQQIVGHDLSFKEFTLALKQRAALTSPQRISILKFGNP